jgi:hypothetical protein
MLEAKVQSTQALKEKGQDFWDDLKKRNLAFAERLSSFDPKLAQRVEECADIVKFKECANGFLAFKSARFCRVRGCPMCEWRRSRRIAKLVARAVEKLEIKPNDKWQQLGVSIHPIPVSELSRGLDDLCNGFSRLSQLKAWRIQGGFRFIQLQWMEDMVQPSIQFLGLFPARMMGKNYISKDKWTKLWVQSVRHESVPEADTQNFGAIPFVYVAHKSKLLAWRSLNLELCPDTSFVLGFQEIHRRKFLTATGCFRDTFTQKKEPSREYYPSEKLAIWGMRSRYFGHLPNPNDNNHDNQFLLLPEYCWNEELLAELGDQWQDFDPETSTTEFCGEEIL